MVFVNQDNNNYSTYSIGSPAGGGNWTISAPAVISSTKPVSLDTNVFCCYNTAANKVFATWSEADIHPIYSIYSSGSWSAPADISTISYVEIANVFPSYGVTTEQVFATWAGFSRADHPIYSMYPGVMMPPMNVQGIQFSNQYITETEFFNRVSWQQPFSSLAIIQYNVYRNAGLTDLAATVYPWQPFEFIQHNVDPKLTYSYYVESVGDDSAHSTAVGVTIYPR